MYGYESLIRCGWTTGVHDVRGCRYQHPYVVIYRPAGIAAGCWSRQEARETLRRMRRETGSAAQAS